MRMNIEKYVEAAIEEAVARLQLKIVSNFLFLLRYLNQFDYSTTSLLQRLLYNNNPPRSGRVLIRRRIKRLKDLELVKPLKNIFGLEEIITLTSKGKNILNKKKLSTIRPLHVVNWGYYFTNVEVQKIFIRFRKLGYFKFHAKHEYKIFGKYKPSLVVVGKDEIPVIVQFIGQGDYSNNIDEIIKQYLEYKYRFKFLFLCKYKPPHIEINQNVTKYDEAINKFFAISLDSFHNEDNDQFLDEFMGGKPHE